MDPCVNLSLLLLAPGPGAEPPEVDGVDAATGASSASSRLSRLPGEPSIAAGLMEPIDVVAEVISTRPASSMSPKPRNRPRRRKNHENKTTVETPRPPTSLK